MGKWKGGGDVPDGYVGKRRDAAHSPKGWKSRRAGDGPAEPLKTVAESGGWFLGKRGPKAGK
jgi:hypothetical protein